MDDIMAPTPEQQREGGFVVQDVTDKRRGGGTITIGKAYCRRRQVEQLSASGLFTDEEAKALRHYRHHADLIERSPTRDSLCLQRGGSGNGRTITFLNAAFLVGQVEAAVGSLADILRAVVVEDVSLSQWAIRRSGGIDTRRERKGRVVTAIEPKQKALAIAKLEMKLAAQRVASELRAG